MARPSAKRQAATAVDAGYMVAWARPCFLGTTLGAVPLLALHPHLGLTLSFPALPLLQVDVFSFSIVCWECLTGEVPWRELAGHMQIIFAVGVNHEVSSAAVHCNKTACAADQLHVCAGCTLGCLPRAATPA